MDTLFELSLPTLGSEMLETILPSGYDTQELDALTTTSPSSASSKQDANDEEFGGYSSLCWPPLDLVHPIPGQQDDGSYLLQVHSDHSTLDDLMPADTDIFTQFCKIPDDAPISDEELDRIVGDSDEDTTGSQVFSDCSTSDNPGLDDFTWLCNVPEEPPVDDKDIDHVPERPDGDTTGSQGAPDPAPHDGGSTEDYHIQGNFQHSPFLNLEVVSEKGRRKKPSFRIKKPGRLSKARPRSKVAEWRDVVRVEKVGFEFEGMEAMEFTWVHRQGWRDSSGRLADNSGISFLFRNSIRCSYLDVKHGGYGYTARMRPNNDLQRFIGVEAMSQESLRLLRESAEALVLHPDESVPLEV